MSHRKWVQQGSCLLVGFLVIGVLSSLVVQAQQDLPTEQRRKPIYFRRVYVPASDLDKLIQGTMPLKRESFVDMVEAINRSARDALTSSEVRVVSAKYSARLVGDDLIDGKALLEIEKPTGEPALLPLSPSGLAWGRPQWEAATALPAVAGMDGTGRWFVLVEKSGTLRIPWSLQGMVASGNRKQFDFWIPPSSTSRLEVQLPEQTVLSSGHGFVSAPPELPKTETNRPDRSSNSPASE